MQFLRFDIFGDKVLHGMSLRSGGVSEGVFGSLNMGLIVGDSDKNVAENYRRFCDGMDVPMDKLCVAHQEHTDKVMRVDEGVGFDKPFSGVDGFMTDRKGVPLVVRFADCQGVLYFDPVRRVVAAVHAGWRGNTKNIIGKAVKKMGREYGSDPADILVGVGPSLCPNCAEFSDPNSELPEFMHKYINGRHVDLWQCAYDQLVIEGVKPEHIEIMRRCTVCENDKFFSFRVAKQEGFDKSGHMAGMIML